MTYLIFAYLLVMNLIAMLVTVIDKSAAIHSRQRISEKSLILIAVFGGAPMMLLTMLMIRHKTRKPLFMIGIPVIIVLELLVLFVVLKYVFHVV